MFCKQCGAQIEAAATVCPKCSIPLESSNPTSAVTEKMTAASKDSLQAFLKFATDPVAGLSGAYESLGSARALSVGICFGVVDTICILLAAYRLIPEFLRPPGAGGFLKLLVGSLLPFVSLAAFSALARLLFRGKGDLSNDSFIAGASLLPVACAMLLGSLLGAGNMQVISALMMIALCLTVLMLFAGLSRISKLTERLATMAVPLVLLLSGWLTKAICTSMLNAPPM
jgi:hypothetical protein